MAFISTLEIDTTYLNDLKETLLLEYGLFIRLISETNHSFERALSICLFGNEEEVESISSTLSSHYDCSYRKTSNEDDCYITLAAQTYGITIHIHHNNSTKLYEIECDRPIVHIVRVLLKDGSWIYLATEKVDENNDIGDVGKDDEQSSDEYGQQDVIHTRSGINSLSQFKTLCSLNIGVRKVKADGNCFFRALSDQLCGSEEGHLVLRQLIMDYIYENREKFEASIDQEYFSNWEDFMYKTRQRGTYADGIVVAASALSLRRSIIIHQHSQRPVLFKPSICNTSFEQIHLAYDDKTLHYSSLCSINSNKLHIDDSECTLG